MRGSGEGEAIIAASARVHRMSAVTSLESKPEGARGRRKERSQRAEELMAVALELFSQRDYASVTIKDIASARGVNTALIYYYFENKEDLFRSAIEYAVSQALENYRRLGEKHDDPVDLMRDWLRNNVELSEPIRQLVKIMIDWASSPARAVSIDAAVRQFYAEEARILSSSIRRGIALDMFQEVDAEATAAFVSVHLDGIMVASVIRADFDISAAMAELEDQLWQMLGYQPDNPERMPQDASAAG